MSNTTAQPHAARDAGHTPGPWRVTTHDAPSRLIKVESRDRVICDAFHGETANAALISAAPDLLNALEMVLNDPNAGDLMGCVLTAIHGAIDKAKGGGASHE